MKPPRSFYARLAHAAHPFDLVVVSIVAVAALPVPGGWAIALWTGLMITVALVLRHGSKQRASELSRAFVVSPRDGGRRPDELA